MKTLKVLTLLLMFGLVGCSGVPVKFNTIEKSAGVDQSKGRKISASAAGFQLLLFIPISINSRLQRAHQALLAEAGADQIADVKVTESWTWAFVGTVYRTTLDATAYPKP